MTLQKFHQNRGTYNTNRFLQSSPAARFSSLRNQSWRGPAPSFCLDCQSATTLFLSTVAHHRAQDAVQTQSRAAARQLLPENAGCSQDFRRTVTYPQHLVVKLEQIQLLRRHVSYTQISAGPFPNLQHCFLQRGVLGLHTVLSFRAGEVERKSRSPFRSHFQIFGARPRSTWRVRARTTSAPETIAGTCPRDRRPSVRLTLTQNESGCALVIGSAPPTPAGPGAALLEHRNEDGVEAWAPRPHRRDPRSRSTEHGCSSSTRHRFGEAEVGGKLRGKKKERRDDVRPARGRAGGVLPVCTSPAPMFPADQARAERRRAAAAMSDLPHTLRPLSGSLATERQLCHGYARQNLLLQRKFSSADNERRSGFLFHRPNRHVTFSVNPELNPWNLQILAHPDLQICISCESCESTNPVIPVPTLALALAGGSSGVLSIAQSGLTTACLENGQEEVNRKEVCQM
ncbi:MAG: hypothetical protein BJ554DRAFT_6244 [Olpidium bornovanus]|uniref:Uncharacterized protein n=1 Tax=Olpidium bornovanus TaxID=278681 RepID=A0A8H8DKC0_9FUNG|nr:MAG: hypothetical protein BJ554DRAFT_6244 [Olpidium bornovanus]